MTEKIEDLLEDVNNKIYLPGLQREFVWSLGQIETLFDSLIRGYPIGVLLQWDIRRARDNYYAYEFIQNYIADNGRVPDPVSRDFIRNNKEIDEERDNVDVNSLIIDGQQRLNSLYIGIYGSVATYTGGSGRSRDESRYWDQKMLCVNLFGHPQYDSGNYEYLSGDYEFSFKKSDMFSDEDEFGYDFRAGTHRYWFPLKNTVADDGLILDQYDLKEQAKERIRSTSIEANEETRDALEESASLVMDEFFNNIVTGDLPVVGIKMNNPHIKEIFQRINTQGKEPKPYQLMLSKLMSTWPYVENHPFNPRQKVEHWIEDFKADFAAYEEEIDRDLFMIYSYMLLDSDLSGKSSVNDLSNLDMEKLRKKWRNGPEESSSAPYEWFPRAMEKSLQTLVSIGLSGYIMDSKNHIALLTKFFYENPSVDHTDSEVCNNVFRFFATLMLLNDSHGLLRRTKAKTAMPVLSENKGRFSNFPAEDLFDSLEVSPARENIERVVEHARYNPNAPGDITFTTQNVAAILGLLDGIYGNRNISDYEVDHIFPQSREEEVKNAAKEDIDIHRIGNLQLLRNGVNNNEKNTQWPQNWLDDISGSEQGRYQDDNLYPDNVDMVPEKYVEFVESRENLVKETLIDKYVSSNTNLE